MPTVFLFDLYAFLVIIISSWLVLELALVVIYATLKYCCYEVQGTVPGLVLLCLDTYLIHGSRYRPKTSFNHRNWLQGGTGYHVASFGTYT